MICRMGRAARSMATTLATRLVLEALNMALAMR
jgi:hypothetical protein